MKTKRLLLGIGLLLTMLVGTIPATAATELAPRHASNQAIVTGPATMVDTEVSILHSDITGTDYRIYVAFPRGYADDDATYPVVFLLDGNWHFATATSVFEAYNAGELPGVVLVGIGYPIDDDFDCIPFREQDFLPENNADLFLTFLEDELIPYIDANYRTDGEHRTLVGHSYGGLFALHALFSSDAFDSYLALSPALWYGPNWDGERYIFDLEEAFYESQDTKKPTLQARLFLGVGEMEPEDEDWGFTQPWMVSNVIEFSKVLKRHHYQGLEVETDVIEELGHMGSFPGAFIRGLHEVLR